MDILRGARSIAELVPFEGRPTDLLLIGASELNSGLVPLLLGLYVLSRRWRDGDLAEQTRSHNFFRGAASGGALVVAMACCVLWTLVYFPAVWTLMAPSKTTAGESSLSTAYMLVRGPHSLMALLAGLYVLSRPRDRS